ncbi:hypothetical protein [Actinokineospora sp. UTMC 2448]|uniref:hypothetical protein n=1 Tax=Actinokineospora sp. UTMC 2448 TaxID=2268449 RepID=UPI0021646712|nr:hypothetical protein [Actinokineospora sp. UTMC 2448]
MIVLRLTRAALSMLAVSAVTLAQLNLPSKATWDDLSLVLYCSVFLIAAFLLHDAVFTVDYIAKAARAREYELQLRASLSATIGELVDEFGVRWDEVGVYHYRLSGFRWRRRLTKVGGMLAGVPPNDMPTSYDIGKGVPGLAVQERMLVTESWRQFVERWEQSRPRDWEDQPSDHRYGLDWDELMSSDRVEAIVANPQYSAGRLTGCIVVTGPFKPLQMSGSPMRRIMSNTATQIKHLGPPPRGWRNHAS